VTTLAPATPTAVADSAEARAYHDALAALSGRGRFGIRLGLGRTRALLRLLGDPQLGIRGALVAGTNGKGSVLALAGSALREAGHRVGETPKPHLVTYRERIVVDGLPIGAGDFAQLAHDALAAAARIDRRLGTPTEFELLTAMLFRWFGEQQVDLALVEVGLGGRLDATHAWDGGVAVVTNIGLDHTDRLGDTVEAIAREKAAIIERGDLAVTGADGPALAVIRRRARRLAAPLTVVADPRVLELDRDGIVVELPRLGRARVGLRGRHQAANVAVADALLDALEAAGIARASSDQRRRGYERARWPGRLELLDVDGHDLLLDGAHNPAGAASLAQALDDLEPYLRESHRRPTLLMAVMADKDVDGIVAALRQSPLVRRASIVATQVEAVRALPAAALAARWEVTGPDRRVVAEADVGRALRRALDDAQGPVIVAGSLYLVGAIRARLVDDPRLRDPEPVR
jgi:dihydrofolate synthase/folylpolyglutamate synthase